MTQGPCSSRKLASLSTQIQIRTPPKTILKGRLGMSLAKKEADCIFDGMATRDALVASEGHIVCVD